MERISDSSTHSCQLRVCEWERSWIPGNSGGVILVILGVVLYYHTCNHCYSNIGLFILFLNFIIFLILSALFNEVQLFLKKKVSSCGPSDSTEVSLLSCTYMVDMGLTRVLSKVFQMVSEPAKSNF